MKNRKLENRIIRRVPALMVALCLLLTSCSSGAEKVNVTKKVSSRNVITFDSGNTETIHYAESADSYKSVGNTDGDKISSGLIELRIDESTASFAICDTTSNVLWSALPILEDTSGYVDDEIGASVVTLKIAGGTDVYELNSQDNSLAYGTAKAEVDKETATATFTYGIYTSKETAEKHTSKDIGFDVTVKITLKDGNMNATCTWKNATGNPDAYIEDLEFLNYFGAYNEMNENNFLFVPDGCGAIINTSVYDESFTSLSFNVYGNSERDADGNAVIPVFGMRRSSGAMAAIIEEGDAVATIKADKATALGEYNHAYPVFNITPVEYTDETLYVSSKPSVSQVSLCYRFLTGKNATYAGLASAVREQLIRNGVLSTRTVDESENLPFYVTVPATTKSKFLFFTRDEVLTSPDEAHDLLARMKNKGINNINMIYTNALDGGADQKDIRDAGLCSAVGSQKDIDELYDYMLGQNMRLYFGVDLLSASDGLSKKETAKNMQNKNETYTPSDGLITSTGCSFRQRMVRKISAIKDVVSSILSYTRDLDFDGICIQDAGTLLYPDYEDGLLRQNASYTLADIVSPLSTNRSVMIDGGNFYMLKNAESIVNLPLTTSVAKSGAYEPVPFVQMVLHGIVDYAGESINTVSDSDIELKCIEYGACPHYEWTYTETGDSRYYYDNSINEAAGFYTEADEALRDLQDARITDHYEVSDGVFCTEYDTGSIIYVNYTDSDYDVLGLTVSAGDYLRIN